jgi:ABC-type uncharacterized transport system ATPase subunit
VEKLGAERRVVFTIRGEFALEPLRPIPGVTRVDRSDERVVVYGTGEQFVGQLVNFLASSGSVFRDFHTEQPNLEDVFLALTGREMRD